MLIAIHSTIYWKVAVQVYACFLHRSSEAATCCILKIRPNPSHPNGWIDFASGPPLIQLTARCSAQVVAAARCEIWEFEYGGEELLRHPEMEICYSWESFSFTCPRVRPRTSSRRFIDRMHGTAWIGGTGRGDCHHSFSTAIIHPCCSIIISHLDASQCTSRH